MRGRRAFLLDSIARGEASSYDHGEVDALEARIARAESAGGNAASELLAHSISTGLHMRARTITEGQELPREFRAALATSGSASGGDTVPPSWTDQLVYTSRGFGWVEFLAGKWDTPAATSPANWPIVNDDAVSTLVPEGGAYGNAEDSVGNATFEAFKFGHTVRASDEFVDDFGFDLSAYIQERAGRATTRGINPLLVSGVGGTTEPQGILPGNTVGVTTTTGATTTQTAANVLDLYHSIDSGYRLTASWIMGDATRKGLRGLKDASASEPLLRPGRGVGEPDTIEGRPVYIDPNFPAATAGVRSIYFGDVAQNYVVKRSGPTMLKVLLQPFALNGQVGFRVSRRIDGRVVNPAAARVLVQAAT